MLINKSSIDSVFKGLRTVFMDSVEATERPEILDELCAEVPSNTSINEYPVAHLLGDLEEIVDEVTIMQIGSWLQEVDNPEFGKGFAVKRTHIEDDQVGVYRQSAESLGRRAEQWPAVLAQQAIVDAFSDEWIDGTTIFYGGTDRTWPNGDQQLRNLRSLALTQDNFETLYGAMIQQTGPDGNELGLEPTHLLHGADNQAAAEEVIEAAQVDGTTNTNYEKVELRRVKNLGSRWGLVDADPQKPMVFQDRRAADLERSPEDSERAMIKREYNFVATRRCNVAILAPWLFYMSDGGS